MLIEFKVANFRSIREMQTLSLVASNAVKELPDRVIERDLPGLSGVKFLKGAALYGANASGKSNILEAIIFLGRFVITSATKIQPGEPTGTEPFKLDLESSAKPSEFEITFVADDIRYVFGLSVTPHRVIEEYLIAYPKGVPRRWYHRKFNEVTNDYTWDKPSTDFKLDKDLQEKTRENALFLSVGPQFNHLQLTLAFNWFMRNLNFINLGAGVNLYSMFRLTAELIKKETHHDRILSLLRSADLGVSDARILEDVYDPDELRRLLPASQFSDLEKKNLLPNVKKLEIELTHKAEGTEPVSLNFVDEESAGTRRFFELIGPWTDILDNGLTVFVDEIETSLHPILVKELLKLIFSSETNPNGAQIVFTTHNPILLDNSLMRRDQIWFTEKTPAGTTHLYPLTDYQPRKDEALAKGYLAGRYGAIPYLPEGLKL